MATWLAQQIVRQLLTSAVIDPDDKELYVYGFFLLISKVLYFSIAFITGIILKIPFASIVFYLSFLLLRGYAGGVHAKTETACTILTSLAIIGSLLLIKIMLTWQSWTVPTLMLIGASISIWVLSPLDTAEKPLDEYEKTQYRRFSIAILCGYLLGIGITWYLVWKNISYALITTVFLESLLLAIGKKHTGCQHST